MDMVWVDQKFLGIRRTQESDVRPTLWQVKFEPKRDSDPKPSSNPGTTGLKRRKNQGFGMDMSKSRAQPDGNAKAATSYRCQQK